MTAGRPGSLERTRKWLEAVVRDVAKLMGSGGSDGLATITLAEADLAELRELYALVAATPDSGDPLRILIQRTDEVVQMDGRPVRRWHGQTVGGVHCDVYVALVAVRQDQDTGVFEEAAEAGELIERPAPPEHEAADEAPRSNGHHHNGGRPID